MSGGWSDARAPVAARTEQLVGGGGGEVELLLQVLPQEGGEPGHHADLHAGRQRDAGEHGVGQQVLGHLGDHCGRGRPGETIVPGLKSFLYFSFVSSFCNCAELNSRLVL